MIILVTGGARSGKSSFAEQFAYRTAKEGIYIATAEALDDEMKARIVEHQAQRKQQTFTWSTVEEPLHAAQYLEQLATVNANKGQSSTAGKSEIADVVILLDCLTLWLTNWLLKLEQVENREVLLEREIARLLAALQLCPYPIVVVTNEVGDGIVPTYELGRWFRDEAGRLNQRVAQLADRAFLVTAGIPIDLKALAYQWEEQ